MDSTRLTPNEVERIAHMRAKARSGEARKARTAAGLSINELAQAIGVDFATLARWERGDSRPMARHCLAWASLLERLSPDLSSTNTGERS